MLRLLFPVLLALLGSFRGVGTTPQETVAPSVQPGLRDSWSLQDSVDTESPIDVDNPVRDAPIRFIYTYLSSVWSQFHLVSF